MIKIDLHSHNKEHSICASQTLDENIKHASKNGIKLLAITNHNYITDLSNINNHGIKLTTGVEISCYIYVNKIKYSLHILGIGLKIQDYDMYNRILKNKSKLRDKEDIKYTLDLIKEMNGISVWAHPTRKINNDSVIEEIVRLLSKYKIDGLEVIHPDNAKNNKIDFLLELCKKYNLHTTIGSDNHSVNEKYFNFDISEKTYKKVLEKIVKI